MTTVFQQDPPQRRGRAPDAEPTHTWLTTTEAAQRVRVHPQTMARWRWDGSGPPCSRLPGRRIRYSATALDAWLIAQQQSPGGPE